MGPVSIPTRRAHVPEECTDWDCPRYGCRMFHRGYDAGFGDGRVSGQAEGEARGYLAGYQAAAGG